MTTTQTPAPRSQAACPECGQPAQRTNNGLPSKFCGRACAKQHARRQRSREQLVDEAISIANQILGRRDGGAIWIRHTYDQPVNTLTAEQLRKLLTDLDHRLAAKEAPVPKTTPTDQPPAKKLPPPKDVWEQISDLLTAGEPHQCDRCDGHGVLLRRMRRPEIKQLLTGASNGYGVSDDRLAAKLENPTVNQLETIRQTAGLSSLDAAYKLAKQIRHLLTDTHTTKP